MSLLSYIDDNYIEEHIFKIVKKTSINTIVIDALKMTVSPLEFDTATIRKSLIFLKDNLKRQLEADQLTFENIKSAIITITYDLDKTSMSETVPDLELAKYDCNVEIVDSNGKAHKVTFVEWWRY